jgi:hypothetical protein
MMSVGQIVGIVFFFTGLMDLILGFAFVGPRIENASNRRIVQMALVVGAVTLFALGAAFFTGAIGMGPATA